MEKITPSDWGGMAWSIGFTLHENLYEITHHFAIERSHNHLDLDTCLERKKFQKATTAALDLGLFTGFKLHKS